MSASKKMLSSKITVTQTSLHESDEETVAASGKCVVIQTETDRQRQTDRDRQTDRQTDRQKFFNPWQVISGQQLSFCLVEVQERGRSHLHPELHVRRWTTNRS